MTADRRDRGDRAGKDEIRGTATTGGVCAGLREEALRLQSGERTASHPTQISFGQAIDKMRGKRESLEGCGYSGANIARMKQQSAIEEALRAQARDEVK